MVAYMYMCYVILEHGHSGKNVNLLQVQVDEFPMPVY